MAGGYGCLNSSFRSQQHLDLDHFAYQQEAYRMQMGLQGKI